MAKYEVSQTIDIAGPDGNVFNLIGIGRNWLKQFDADDQREEFSKEMTAGDYNHALATFRRWFGEDTLENSNDDNED